LTPPAHAPDGKNVVGLIAGSASPQSSILVRQVVVTKRDRWWWGGVKQD
jgi:hypothetical protein